MRTDRKSYSAAILPPLHKPPTREEIIALTQAAKEAAMVGNHERTEIYRQLGVSIIDVARAIGTSRDWEYTEFLITENPQLFPKVDARKKPRLFSNLATEFAIGFTIVGERDSANKLFPYGADPEIVAAVAKKYLLPLIALAPKGAPSFQRKKSTVETIIENATPKRNTLPAITFTLPEAPAVKNPDKPKGKRLFDTPEENLKRKTSFFHAKQIEADSGSSSAESFTLD
ncbi:MAG: hypothetical protein NTU49_09765 [Gammaproteobacteria bacterium]|nr:hypothetical protein [Gammaproteobacteria bacterium]